MATKKKTTKNYTSSMKALERYMPREKVRLVPKKKKQKKTYKIPKTPKVSGYKWGG